MDVDAVTLSEKVYGVELTDAERDLLRKEARYFKCQKLGHVRNSTLSALLIQKTSTGDRHARTCLPVSYPGRPPMFGISDSGEMRCFRSNQY